VTDIDGDPEPLLRVADVCAWFQVQPPWVYDEVEAGRLPHLRLGRRHLRFERAQLREYLKTRHRHRTQPRRARSPSSLEPLTDLTSSDHFMPSEGSRRR
jgi:excisionase family DNA binding protein